MTKPANFANDLRDQLIALFQPSDNKLAMKLFGNKNALLKEKLRQKAVGKWVIHPCSNFRCRSLFLSLTLRRFSSPTRTYQVGVWYVNMVVT